MYSLAQNAAARMRVAASAARRGPVGAPKPGKRVVAPMRLSRVVKRYRHEEPTYQAVVKIEGKAALKQKLEDPVFRRNYILNPELPAGRDIWKDNPRLDIRLRADPLPYTWPAGKDFSEYDPVLKRNWEDEMFEKKWNGDTKGQVQGGDWANNRINREVPPRIKIYYATIVDNYQQGLLIAATKAFNALLEDYLAPQGSIPYGVYHTMMIVYLKRERYHRAFDMLNEILQWHTPTPDDYALGMETLLLLRQPAIALDLWRSFQLRPSLSINAAMYSQLFRTYAMMRDIEQLQNAFEHAKKACETRSDLPLVPILRTMIEVYAELGFQPETKQLIETITPTMPASLLLSTLVALNQAGLYADTIKYFRQWFPDTSSITNATWNTILRAYVELKDLQGIESTLAKITAFGVDPLNHMTTYSILITNRFRLQQSDVVQQQVMDGLELKNIRPSVRNYRAMLAANVNAHATTDFAVAQNALKEMEAKKIDFDPNFLEAITNGHQLGDLNALVDIWHQQVVKGKLIPTLNAFSLFFTIAGLHNSSVNVALVWRLSRELKIMPDFRFASSLAIALQPDRNYFGLIETRRAHQRWTSQPHSIRVLTKQEFKDFSKFIEHVISTFPEKDMKAFESSWKETRVTFYSDPVVGTQEADVKTTAKPVILKETVKRIFAADAQYVLPEPGKTHQDDAARNVGVFAGDEGDLAAAASLAQVEDISVYDPPLETIPTE